MSQLSIATAQFPVAASSRRNRRYVTDLMQRARDAGADVVHFPEACLGGYAGMEVASWEGYDWPALAAAEATVRETAAALGIAVVYGTNHRVRANDVRNRLVYVTAAGKEAAHYDKRFCTGGDLEHYRCGKRFATFTVHGFRCGLLICYDVRFPEMYRAYKQRGTQVIFHSFYNARAHKANIHTTIMRATLQARAATNGVYVSAANAAGYYQSWPSVFVLPDGRIAGACRQHRSGLIVTPISSTDEFYDASRPYRDRAMAGILHSAD